MERIFKFAVDHGYSSEQAFLAYDQILFSYQAEEVDNIDLNIFFRGMFEETPQQETYTRRY